MNLIKRLFLSTAIVSTVTVNEASPFTLPSKEEIARLVPSIVKENPAAVMGTLVLAAGLAIERSLDPVLQANKFISRNHKNLSQKAAKKQFEYGEELKNILNNRYKDSGDQAYADLLLALSSKNDQIWDESLRPYLDVTTEFIKTLKKAGLSVAFVTLLLIVYSLDSTYNDGSIFNNLSQLSHNAYDQAADSAKKMLDSVKSAAVNAKGRIKKVFEKEV